MQRGGRDTCRLVGHIRLDRARRHFSLTVLFTAADEYGLVGAAV